MPGDRHLFSPLLTTVASKVLGLGANGPAIFQCAQHHQSYVRSITDKNDFFAYPKYCWNLQSDDHSHPSPSSRLVMLLKFTDASIQVS
jgi:hypothetical protein